MRPAADTMDVQPIDDSRTPVQGELDETCVHVWTVRPDELDDAELLSAYEALMNDEERARRDRFRYERGRHECLVTRALVRTTLSRYADVPPERWEFVVNKHGAPSLAPDQCERPLRFNLAHTRGLIACAVTVGADVGVDVEFLDRRGETVSLADHFFSPSEVADLHALPPGRQEERFFHYWTLKESYIKARGMGLAIPLAHFSFRFAGDADLTPGALDGCLGGGAIGISFEPELDDEPGDWQFALHAPDELHRLAVGVRRPAGADLAVQVASTVPLADG